MSGGQDGPRAIARSAPGASHRRCWRGCDDASLLVRVGPALYAAVGDGAGSAPLAAEGARAAATQALRRLLKDRPDPRDHDWRGSLRKALIAGRQGVFDRARRLGRQPAELATTLIVTAATPAGLIAAQVGDGAVVIEEAGRRDARLATVTKGRREAVANVTRLLTSYDFALHARYARRLGRLRAFAVFTDGLENLALDRHGEPFAPFFQPLWGALRAAGDRRSMRRLLNEFLQSPKLAERTDDDITLAIGLFPESTR
ncbi:protein phosphatase 2C domain-containing protein [Botrimarina mediterranea]|uniref:protein phosphatase 2C domain-containing protein n=1 Tax=Botrimarina mediterranea TaxID=2528022 RepID=UPI00118788DF|nr:hypothetical protein K2D_26900 [Planctomycetes bacterium K2D]